MSILWFVSCWKLAAAAGAKARQLNNEFQTNTRAAAAFTGLRNHFYKHRPVSLIYVILGFINKMYLLLYFCVV
jgi:hypothetical protein